jgi:hypothetical protein
MCPAAVLATVTTRQDAAAFFRHRISMAAS